VFVKIIFESLLSSGYEYVIKIKKL